MRPARIAIHHPAHAAVTWRQYLRRSSIHFSRRSGMDETLKLSQVKGGEPMLKVFSFGGGVQSTAALVLAARGEIDYQTFLFANVGGDSENPETLRYVRE